MYVGMRFFVFIFIYFWIIELLPERSLLILYSQQIARRLAEIGNSLVRLKLLDQKNV